MLFCTTSQRRTSKSFIVCDICSFPFSKLSHSNLKSWQLLLGFWSDLLYLDALVYQNTTKCYSFDGFFESFQEYEELTSKLHDFSVQEQCLKERLQLHHEDDDDVIEPTPPTPTSLLFVRHHHSTSSSTGTTPVHQQQHRGSASSASLNSNGIDASTSTMVIDSTTSTSPPFHQLAFTHDDYFPSDQDSLAPSSSLLQVCSLSDLKVIRTAQLPPFCAH